MERGAQEILIQIQKEVDCSSNQTQKYQETEKIKDKEEESETVQTAHCANNVSGPTVRTEKVIKTSPHVSLDKERGGKVTVRENTSTCDKLQYQLI